MTDTSTIQVECVFAQASQQWLFSFQVPRKISIKAFLNLPEVREKFPAEAFEGNAVGVFGEKCDEDYLLKEGDRVELYRPLVIDPMEMRRVRAGVKKRKKQTRVRD